jgi:phage gp46-like protein
MSQQGDVFLFQTNDDGDINVDGGVVEMAGGLPTSAYLSLFGGNEDDDGRASNELTWWGNLDESEPSRQYRSETQNLLRSIPAVSRNLLRIQDAANRDLQWLLDENVASSINVVASIPGLNKVNLEVSIIAIGGETKFNFTENWKERS